MLFSMTIQQQILSVSDFNEIKPTTVAPSWLPKGPDKTKVPKEIPQFDSNLVTNVTVQLGESAFLRCKVRNLGEHKVRGDATC